MRRLLPLLPLALLFTGCVEVASIDVDPAQQAVTRKGATAQFKGTPKNKDGVAIPNVRVRFESSDPKVASCTPDGLCTALDTGDAVIRAFEDKKDKELGHASLQVSLPFAISVSPDSVKLDGIGQTTTINARVLDSKGREVPGELVTWENDQPSVVSINRGELTAVGIGIANLFALSNGIKAPVSVEVRQPPLSAIEVSPTSVTTKVDEAVKLTPLGKDPSGQPAPGAGFRYAVKDPAIATVDAAGTIHPLKPGKTEVEITAGGATATVPLTVRK